MWLALRYIGKDIVNMIVSLYFTLMGTISVAATASDLLAFVSSWHRAQREKPVINWRAPAWLEWVLGGEEVTVKATVLEMAFLCGAGGVSWAYASRGNWLASNVIGLCLSTQAIALLNLGSFATGAVLLGALFFYDVFFVFYTPIMVAVAKGIDAPIKVVFPKDLGATGLPEDFTMLGLGDIVIPGVLIALLMRFDLERAYRALGGKPSYPAPRYSKPYFWTALAGYCFALALTIGIMTVFKRAQPALLYLSPVGIIVPLLVALVRGEVGALWAFSEEESEDEAKSKKKVAKKNK